MGRLWAALKFFGRWLGPALILIAACLFIIPPMPFVDLSGTLALAGAIVTAIACIFMRAPERQRKRKILAACALVAFAFAGWRYWEAGSGYHKEIVSFDNRGAHLVGTLYLPDRQGKVPGLVFLPGSGKFKRSSFQDFAAHFARNGYAVLLYDKRGVGDSSGKFGGNCFLCIENNLELLADDAAAGLSFLAARPEVAGQAVGIAGVSQGGLVAPRAAALNGRAAFMLILTGPTTTFYDIIQFQDPSGQALANVRRAGIADFDPMPSLRALNIPGFWVMADGDTLVSNRASIRDIESLRQLGKPYEYRVIPGAWHGLFFGPRKLVLDTIDSWLAQVASQKSPSTTAAVVDGLGPIRTPAGSPGRQDR